MSNSGSERRSSKSGSAGAPAVAGVGSGAAAGKGGGGLIQRLLGIFVGIVDPDAEKKKLLRVIAKDLSRSRYKFYRPKGQEALPGLAKFFYETYKITAPAQVLLGNASASGALRSFVIESFLSKEQRELTERLTEAYILERSKSLGLKELQEEIKRDMTALFSVF
ncbi:MAG TPA: hypothetical protein VMC79_01895, partial [Rectinemataceae bacterium]|nr:hypothetical protein [Rectinemataceae bacterium]